MSTLRICPHCHAKTVELRCAADGYQTVLWERFRGTGDSSLIGSKFHGRYVIQECIGSGGMGAVYRALQLSVNRPVALKILRTDYSRRLEQVGRFQREARAASMLEHPNTIRVYDFGQSDDGELYVALELLEGEPLSELLARANGIEPLRAVRISIQILKSLAEAHSRGIVHRDLKPENIFLKEVHGEQDFVKVLDFGIAKVADPTGREKNLTTTGTVVGTPLYMSPEQARGRQVDARSDLYSLGAVLYEMLTGTPLFTGESAMEVMLAHVQNSIPALPRSVKTKAPGLARVLKATLAKSPTSRPASADELRENLEAIEARWSVSGSKAQDAKFQVPVIEQEVSAQVSKATMDTLRFIDGGDDRRRRLTWALVGITILTVIFLIWIPYDVDQTLPSYWSTHPVARPPNVARRDTVSNASQRPENAGGIQSHAARTHLQEDSRRTRRIPEVAATGRTSHYKRQRKSSKRKRGSRAAQPLRVRKQ